MPSSDDIPALRALLEMCESSPGDWHRNGKSSAGWRLDTYGNERAGLDYLMHPLAMVRDDKDADLIVAAVNNLPWLLDEVGALRRDFAHAKGVLKTAEREYQREVEALRAALEFYADETRWIKDQSTPSGGIDLPSFAEKDKGDIARAALSAEEGSDAS